MGFGKSIKKAWSKTMGRGPLSVIGVGKGGWRDKGWSKMGAELKHGLGYLTGANAMEDLAEAQAAANAAQIANAERQASIAAGNVQQTSEAGTESALAKILQKRSALQRSIRTQGQQRLGD